LETRVQHKNNFDFLRLLFASLVIFTHCYALSDGRLTDDPAYRFTHRVFSDFAVSGFFVLSGFLIRQSLERSSSLASFFRKRAMRLLPGLWVAVLFSVFVIGATTSTLPAGRYLTHPDTWSYLLNNAVLSPLQRTLPGLFEQNAETAVNGSLWTLRYEVLFYILLSGLYFIPKARQQTAAWCVLLCCLTGNQALHHFQLPETVAKPAVILCNLGSYFSAGAVLSFYTTFLHKYKGWLLLSAALLFFPSIMLFKKQLETLDIVTYAVLLVSFGLYYFPWLNTARFTGDISYGTYIYAYPIQQTLVAWLHPGSIGLFLAGSLLLSWLAGWLSWKWVEQRFLQRKASAVSRPA